MFTAWCVWNPCIRTYTKRRGTRNWWRFCNIHKTFAWLNRLYHQIIESYKTRLRCAPTVKCNQLPRTMMWYYFKVKDFIWPLFASAKKPKMKKDDIFFLSFPMWKRRLLDDYFLYIRYITYITNSVMTALKCNVPVIAIPRSIHLFSSLILLSIVSHHRWGGVRNIIWTSRQVVIFDKHLCEMLRGSDGII